MDNLFTPEERKDSRSLYINRLETSYYVLSQSGKFQAKPLPIQAQFSPVFASASSDLDGDGNPDLIFGGNLYDTKLKFGRYDANHGTVFLGDGKGGFQLLSPVQSGLSIKGEVRKIVVNGDYLLFYIKDEGIHLLKRHLSKDSSQ